MSFSFEDFLLYTKAPEDDIKLLASIAQGVLTYVEDTYTIFLENTTSKSFTYFLRVSGTTFDLPFSPINSIASITYDGSPQVFTFYGNDIVLSTSITDIRKPLTILANVGFTSLPNDLKLAVYQHIEYLYFKAKNSSDNVEKVVNTAGSTSFFRDATLPKFTNEIYNKYSNRLIAFY